MPPTSRPPVQLVRRDRFSPFICPSCAFSRTFITNKLTLSSRQIPQLSRPSRRHASTIASATAINAPVDVPIAFKDLHKSLQKLKNDAAVYTNLSRLQLALRGLESRNAVVRVAGTKTAGSNEYEYILTVQSLQCSAQEILDWRASLRDCSLRILSNRRVHGRSNLIIPKLQTVEQC